MCGILGLALIWVFICLAYQKEDEPLDPLAQAILRFILFIILIFFIGFPILYWLCTVDVRWITKHL